MIQAPIREQFKPYLDSYGLIVQADGDGGDSANRTAAYAVYAATLALSSNHVDRRAFESGAALPGLRAQFEAQLGKLDGSAPGRYRRHPDATQWYSNQDNFTRDQSIVLQAALVLYGFKSRMRDLLRARLPRLLFHFNSHSGDGAPVDGIYPVKNKMPDPPSPSEVSQFIRGCEFVVLRPLLFFTDAWLLVDLAFNRLKPAHDFEVQFAPLLLSTAKWPTWTSKLAHHFFLKTEYATNLRAYFSVEPYEQDPSRHRNGIPPLAELGIRAIEEP